MVLQTEGYRVLEANNGVQAEKLLGERKRGRVSFAGTALRVLRTNETRPLFH